MLAIPARLPHSASSILKDYGSAVQNLRLIKRPGSNQWGKQDSRWSEAALGEDSSGRVLFLFSRAPFSMHDLMDRQLVLGKRMDNYQCQREKGKCNSDLPFRTVSFSTTLHHDAPVFPQKPFHTCR